MKCDKEKAGSKVDHEFIWGRYKTSKGMKCNGLDQAFEELLPLGPGREG